MKKPLKYDFTKQVYRHWGSKYFDRESFCPISNRLLSNKPSGGLWSSPMTDSDITWEDWCRREDFYTEKLNKYFDFTIKDNAKILVIKNIKDLDNLPRVELEDEEIKDILKVDSMNMDIDFEKLAEEYDGMMVWIYRSTDIDTETKLFDGIYYRLYGWDVDTLLVFNPNIVEELV